MFTRKTALLCLTSFLALTIVSANADQPGSGSTSYALLQNGNVLKGVVSKEKDRICIQVDGNSKLFVDAKQLAFVGPTLESLYQHQVSGVRQWGTGEHWHLAHWCIQQGLLEQAISHYQVLEKTASSSPRFKQLEHLMREALLADIHLKQSAQKQSASAEPVADNGNPVILASSQSPTLLKTSLQEPKLMSNMSTGNDASNDPWIKHEIPGYIRKTFQTSVLPILVARCGQSGCHGMLGKSDFHLYQPVGDQAATLLARDLDEVLRYIDRKHTHDSRLMAYATQAHGIQRNPSLNQTRDDERILIERINQWVKLLVLSQKVETSMPAHYPLSAGAIATPVSPAVANMPIATGLESTSLPQPNVLPGLKPTSTRKSRMIGEPVQKDRNAKLSKPAKTASPTEIVSMAELNDLESIIEKFEKQTVNGDANGSPTRKDPFDPELFNRQFR